MNTDARTTTRRRSRHNQFDERKNIAVDPELITLLDEKAEELETTLGFRPTLSQTVRHLLHTIKRGAQQ